MQSKNKWFVRNRQTVAINFDCQNSICWLFVVPKLSFWGRKDKPTRLTVCQDIIWCCMTHKQFHLWQNTKNSCFLLFKMVTIRLSYFGIYTTKKVKMYIRLEQWMQSLFNFLIVLDVYTPWWDRLLILNLMIFEYFQILINPFCLFGRKAKLSSKCMHILLTCIYTLKKLFINIQSINYNQIQLIFILNFGKLSLNNYMTM